MTEYFPTEDYDLRTEENSGESLSKALSASISNLTSIQRKKNTFFAMTDFSFDNGSSHSRSVTFRRSTTTRPAHNSTTTPTTEISGSHPALLLPHPLQAIVARILGIR